MLMRRLRLSPDVSKVVSKFIRRLCALAGPELAAAVERVRATSDPRALTIAVYTLARQLAGRDKEKQLRAARVLVLFGPVAAPQLVTHLYETTDRAFRLRLVGVLADIGPAAREVVVTALGGLLRNQPDATLRQAAWDGLWRLGPPCEAPAPEKGAGV
jgi:hypothetical protein